MYSLIAIVIALVWIGNDRVCMGQEYKCDVEQPKADQLIKEMFMFAADKQKFPTNETEMKQFCDASKQREKDLKQYGDTCLQNMEKTVLNLFVYSVVKHSVGVCKFKRRGLEFQQMGKCGNSDRKTNKKCWNDWMATLQGIANTTNDKLKIPLACCYISQMSKCLETTFERQTTVCPPKAVSFMDKLFDSYIIDIMGFMCGDYGKDSDKCDKFIAKTPKFAIDKKTKNHSPVKIMVNILAGAE